VLLEFAFVAGVFSKKCKMTHSRDRTGEFSRLVSGARSRLLRHSSAVEHLGANSATPLAAARRARQLSYARLAATTDSSLALQSAVYHTHQAVEEARFVGNRDSELHFCTVEQMLCAQLRALDRAHSATTRTSVQSAAPLFGSIESRIGETERLFGTVLTMLEQQRHSVGRLERNVFLAEARIDASERELTDAAPRAYRGQAARPLWLRLCWPRTVPGRARVLLALLVASNLVLFSIGAM
jgi:hypothetical protein